MYFSRVYSAVRSNGLRDDFSTAGLSCAAPTLILSCSFAVAGAVVRSDCRLVAIGAHVLLQQTATDDAQQLGRETCTLWFRLL